MGTKRDIYNYEGIKIGELELPNSTTEEEWLEKLAEYARPIPPELIPDVTPRQIRQAWVLMGKQLSEIDNAIAALPEPHKTLAQIEWEYSTLVMRNNPLVAMLGVSQGYSPSDLDNLWKFAKTL